MEGMKRRIKSENDAAEILFALVSLPVSTLSGLLPSWGKLLSSEKSIHFADKPLHSCSSLVLCKLLKKKQLLWSVQLQI